MLKQIQQANFIALNTTNDTVPLANALYSYALMQHKKVTLYSQEAIQKRFDFLPWYHKIRATKASSVDLNLVVPFDTLRVYELLLDELEHFNEKVATSLYASFLVELQKNEQLLCDGTKLAAMQQLIQQGADAKTCIENIQKREPLALFRLRSLVFKNFVLHNNATEVCVYLTQELLSASGAMLHDVEQVARELLQLVHVQKVIVKLEEEIIFKLEDML